MANPLQQAGAVAEPSRYAPIHTNRFFTGLWTQRNPLRDAATPFLYEKFYAASRFDSLIGGLNIEVTTKLTLRRRRGHSVYNPNLFPLINSIYEFRRFVSGQQQTNLVVDTPAALYDATNGGKTLLLNKAAGAGATRFQSVGNVLYFGDGMDVSKWINPLMAWAANTSFALGNIIVDTNFNIQQVTTAGTSGAGPQPVWNAAVRGTTADNGIIWTNRGSAIQSWMPAGPVNGPNFSPTNGGNLNMWSPNTTFIGNGWAALDTNGGVQQLITGGPTGASYPNFVKRLTTFAPNTTDASATWRALGAAGVWMANQNINSIATVIVDSNGNWQVTFSAGMTGATAPAWSTGRGVSTTDNTVTWVCYGPATVVTNLGVSYSYAGHLVTGGITSLSPQVFSGPITGSTNFDVTVTGQGFADGQVDYIYIFRTSNGGSTPLLLAIIPNPGATGWSYRDQLPDASLSILTQGPINNQNAPPPAGFLPMAYHLGRIFGAVGNTLFYSNGPTVLFPGNGNEAFNPNNFFILPSTIVRCEPTSIGLLVFTISDVYIVQGSGTSTSPLFVTPFLKGIGLRSWNALSVNGSVFYLMTADNQVIQLDPGAGVTEVGFPIGDQFDALYNPSTAQLTWHVKGSQEKALYVADSATGWFRMNPTPAPETGVCWSPQAQVQGGCAFVQSVEVTPGVRELLMQTAANQPILKRDATATQDNGTAFPMNVTIGSIVLAQPGQLAEIVFFTLDSMRLGTRPTVGALLGEINTLSGAQFETLNYNVFDPPNLPQSTSLFSDRYYMAQNQNPVFCRHLQVEFTWQAEAAFNELLTYTIFGAIHQEMNTRT